MSEQRTTPWSLDRGDDQLILDAQRHIVAMVFRRVESDAMAANRSLIASAPDLLDACELALSVIRYPSHTEVREMLRNAIALARGEAVRCSGHGETEFCYVQPDGSHVSTEECACYCQTEIHCPVSGHTAIARERDHRVGVRS